ncbi:MAG: tetratricopeptide repeat protein [Beijerinckiaceae bacterium]|nr:tetratricopeptide repeat protein [Beijerinckiaceae bacterium]
MADIFREIDEELRRDKASKVWERFRTPIIAVAILIVAAAAAWRANEFYAAKQAEEAGAKYELALQQAREGKGTDAEATLGEIARTGPAGYALLARFRAAGESSVRDPAGAVKIYDALAADPSVAAPLRELAHLRAAVLRVDTADGPELQRRLEPLAQPGQTFRNTAREMLAMAAFKRDDLDAAGRWLDMIIVDAQAPAAIRQRAEALLGLVTGGKAAAPAAPANPAPPSQAAP